MHVRFPPLLALALLLGTFTPRAEAGPVLGGQLFATGGDVVATFLGHSASFTNDLYLFKATDLATPLAVTGAVGPGYSTPGLIFTNQTTAVGTTINLGSFAAGTELVFGIYVRNTGYRFFMGPAGRNADNVVHAAVHSGPTSMSPFGSIPAGMVGVGFEDLYGGGDLDYNDLGFAFSNVRTSVPEPGTWLLLASALLAGLWQQALLRTRVCVALARGRRR